MKIKKTVTALLLAACLSGVFPACGDDTQSPDTTQPTRFEASFSVNLGNYFALPFDGKVKDSNGANVEIIGGAFLASDANGYTLTADGKTYKINVIKKESLQMVASFTDRYVMVGQTISFPVCTATGAVGATTKTYSLKKGDEDYEFDREALSFVPATAGDYTLTITAEDSCQSKGEIVIAFHAVAADDDKMSAIAVFDAPSGVNHFTRIVGFNSPEFTEDRKYGTERGSTRLTVSGGDYFSQTFQMTNFYETDISSYRGMYMYVYNESNQARDMWINWNLRYTLAPNTWNEVYIKNVSSETSKNEYYRDYITDENINGLDFAFNYSSSGGDTASFYFSNLYSDPVLTPEVMEQRLEKLATYSDEILLDSWLSNKVFTDYRSLSEEERTLFDGYSEFVDRYAKLCVPEEKREENVVFAFGTEYGVKQIATPADTIATFTTDKKYKTEKGSTKLTTRNGSVAYTSFVRLNAPLVQKVDDAYFYVWVEGSAETYEASLLNPVNKNSVYANSKTILNKGAWTKVKVPKTTEGLLGCSLQLNVKDWATALPEDTVFYVSSLHFGNTLPQDLQEAAAMSDSELLGSALAKDIFTTYRAMSEADRAKVNGYSEFVDRYAKLCVPEENREEDLAYAFGTEYGIKQSTTNSGITAEFVTDKQHKAESGSTKLTVQTGKEVWSAYLHLNAPLVKESKEAYFYVWVESNAKKEDETPYQFEASLLNPVNKNSVYANSRVNLTNGEWTKVTVPTTTEGLLGCSIQLNVKDWATALPEDTVFYVSSVYFTSLSRKIVDALEMTDNELLDSELSKEIFTTYRGMSEAERAKITNYATFVERYAKLCVPEANRGENVAYAFGTEYGVKQSTTNSGITAEFVTDKQHKAESGSTKLTVQTGKEVWSAYLYLNAPLVQKADKAYFYVWVEGGAETYEASLNNPVNKNAVYSASKVNLTKGAWTVVTVPMTTEGLLGCSVQLNVKDWATAVPEDTIFYVSSLYFGEAPKPTLAEMLTEAADMSDSVLLDSALAKEIFTTYRAMSEADRAKVNGYSEFVDRYAKLCVPEANRGEDVAYAFGTGYGVKQSIANSNITAAFVTDKNHGAESGSTKLTVQTGKEVWSAYLYLNAPLVQECKEAYFYVWVEGSAETYEASLNNPVNKNAVYSASKVNLTKGAWTKVSVPATTEGLLGCSIQLNVKDWATAVPQDTVFYVSNIYFGTENN